MVLAAGGAALHSSLGSQLQGPLQTNLVVEYDCDEEAKEDGLHQ